MALADSEIKATMNEYRPCLINGEIKALFHRWADKEKLILHFHEHMRPDHMASARNYFNEIGAVPDDADLHIHRECCALVEFEDGEVRMVPAESVIFLDSKERFEGYSWEKEI